MPVGLFHPECGPLCMDNFWDKQTAYHLNRINRKTDKRMSFENFYTLLNHYIKEEAKRDLRLFIPRIDDWEIHNKVRGSEYITARIW